MMPESMALKESGHGGAAPRQFKLFDPILTMNPQLQIPSLRRFVNEILIWTSLIGGGLLLVVPERTWLSLLWRLPLAYLIWQVWLTYRMVHPARLFSNLGVRPDEAGLRYQEVGFPSRDGLQLSGFFIPGKLRAALIIVHGAGGSAGSMVQHAEFLAEAGYNLLLLDLRAHGGSEGDTLTFGFKEANDVLGAVDYLHQRLPLSRGRIGVLGVSLGAQAGLRAAQQEDSITALALEGLGPLREAETGRPRSLLRWLLYPLTWLVYRLGDLMTGAWCPPPTQQVIRQLRCPLLLISTGRGPEQAVNRRFYAAAAEPKELLELPEARHAAGLFFEPQQYQTQVVDFFSRTLLQPRA